MIRARAWCRVDLAGGTLDIWPLSILHPGGVTVNVAVDLPVEVGLERREKGYVVHQDGEKVEAETTAELRADPSTALIGVVLEALEVPPVEVEIASASPRGAGLGASSALAIALLVAAERLLGLPESSPERRAAVARDLEARLMCLPTGVQDHYPAMLGGALRISYELGGETARPLTVDLDRLGRHLVIAYTGKSHFSAAKNWQVICRRLEGQERERKLFDGIAEVAAQAASALEEGDLEAVGGLLDREWSLRRQLAEGISTAEVEAVLSAGREAGAWGGKACGAGGGGSVVLLAPEKKRRAVAEAVEKAGGRVLDALPTGEPLQVSVSEELLPR